jgi:hypothetical protein
MVQFTNDTNEIVVFSDRIEYGRSACARCGA